MKNILNTGKKGFTLIEILVVIGIIAVLSGALMAGFGHVTKSAQRARATEAVSQSAQALAILRQLNDNRWPPVLSSYGGTDGSGKGMVEAVAREFAKQAKEMNRPPLLGIAVDSDGKPIGISRFGVVDPWAEAVLKGNKEASIGSKVPSGGTVQDHIIYFAVDTDHDGITTASVGGQQVNVRAEAIAWCAGADGKIAPYSQRGRSDDIYSWDKAKEKR